jgi:cytochrome c556
MIRLTSTAILLVLGATLAVGQGAGQSAITQRKDVMKSNGAAVKTLADMTKGAAPFDLANAQTALRDLQANAAKLKDLFPDDSKMGETNALPVAWEKKADVASRLDKLAADAAALSVAVKDEATLKAEFPKLPSNCVNCHKEYRKPQ